MKNYSICCKLYIFPASSKVRFRKPASSILSNNKVNSMKESSSNKEFDKDELTLQSSREFTATLISFSLVFFAMLSKETGIKCACS